MHEVPYYRRNSKDAMIWTFKCPKEVAIVGALSFRNVDLIEAMELFTSGTDAIDPWNLCCQTANLPL